MRLFCFATDISCSWQVTDTVLLHRGAKYYAKLLVTVLKTKEALKEEKLQRKEEEKRRFNGNNRDFLASVGVNEVMSSQNRRIRLRRTSQTVSECSDGGVGGGISPIDANFKNLKSLTFSMRGETVRVHLIAQVRTPGTSRRPILFQKAPSRNTFVVATFAFVL